MYKPRKGSIMVNLDDLSERQQAIFVFIVFYKMHNDGNAPSVREIAQAAADGAGGLLSTSVVNYNLEKIADAGLIARDSRPKSIKVTGGYLRLTPILLGWGGVYERVTYADLGGLSSWQQRHANWETVKDQPLDQRQQFLCKTCGALSVTPDRHCVVDPIDGRYLYIGHGKTPEGWDQVARALLDERHDLWAGLAGL